MRFMSQLSVTTWAVKGLGVIICVEEINPDIDERKVYKKLELFRNKLCVHTN